MIVDLLTVALKNKYDTEFRDGVHVSDIVLCTRKSIFRKDFPVPVTPKELNFFTRGKAIHNAIQDLMQAYPNRFESEKEVFINGVSAHIDLYDIENNMPIELKSSSSSKMDSPIDHQVEQLKYYMAAVNSTKGMIVYQLLMHREDKPFVEFDITMTEAELEEMRVKAGIKKANYEKAHQTKNYASAENVFENPRMNWLCRDCPYLKKCQEIKNGT